MRQIDRFDGGEPPILRESALRAELERRKLRRQTALLALGGLLSLLCLLLAASLLYPVRPALSIACGAYLCVAAAGAGVIAIVFVRNRRVFSWESQS